MMQNIQLELAHKISTEVCTQAFTDWHKLIFREVVGFTTTTFAGLYSNFNDICCNLISDLLNVLTISDAISLPVHIPARLDKDHMVNFSNEKLHTFKNITSSGYAPIDIVTIVEAIVDHIREDRQKSNVELKDVVFYRILSPEVVVDMNTFKPVMEVYMQYCYRLDNGKFVHPTLLDRI